MKTPKETKKIFMPALIGNIMEWYDFTLYGYFAVVFATLYFPVHDKYSSLIGAYGLLAVSYFMRPIGALVFGYIGDTSTRKKSLSYSIILMGLCSVMVSILPTYETWGIMSAICLAFIRLIQGFAVGGEYSGATLYLLESAPPEKRTFFGSLALSSVYSGFLISSAIGTLLSFIFSPEALAAWGWRLGFAFGGFIALVGLYIRQKLPDTPAHQKAVCSSKVKISPLNALFSHPKRLFLAFGVAILPAGFSYTILVYFLSFLETYKQASPKDLFYMNTIITLFLVLVIPLIGKLGDKIGRKKLMLSAALITMVACIPLFNLLLVHTLVALLLFTLLNALFEACLPAEIAEMFPVNCRYSGLALTLNLTNGIAGGLAPIIATTLVYYSGIIVSPMFYIIALSLISFLSLIAKIMIKESYNDKI